MKSMNLLALDIATVTGWASPTSSGTWNLKPKRGESDGMRVVRFRAKVKELIELEGIKIIAFERPAGRHKASIMVASEMIGVLKDLCMEYKLEYAQYSAGEIKSFATGKGNCGKPAMVEAATKRFDVEIIDDNHADALWLFELAKDDMKL